MTTHCQLQFYGVPPARGRRVADLIMARVAALVARYNFHDAGSWLNRCINGRSTSRVALDGECAAILQVVREHTQQTLGAFDITVGTYSRALRQASSLEQAQRLRAEARAWLGLERWWLEGSWLCFDNPNTRFDLGGVIKEYAVDEAARIARENGVESGLINFGGDLAAIGVKPNGQRFIAAVPNPSHPAQLLFGLDLQDQALTTSGHYARRYAWCDGHLSHVLGNVDNTWVSTSVISPSALLSGIYSTSLLIRHDIQLPTKVLAVAVDQACRLHWLSSY